MEGGNRPRHRGPMHTAAMLYALVPALGFGLFLLMPKAYWSRVREGRSPFAPTLSERRRTLPRASLEGRVLPRAPYLRPTAHCESHAPQVIALADDLRNRAQSDWEYARAIYDFVRNEIVFAVEAPPVRGVVGTLETGCGICVDKLNLLVALARAGGLPARYCTVGNHSLFEVGEIPPEFRAFSQFVETLEGETDWGLKKVGAGLKQLASEREAGRDRWYRIAKLRSILERRWHPIAELKFHECWVPADPSWGDAEAAALGLPLPRLGYDPLILRWMTGSVISRSEEVPIERSYWIVRRLLCLVARGGLDYLNRRLEERRALGRQILAEVGEAEYIRRTRRFYVPLPGLTALGIPPLV